MGSRGVSRGSRFPLVVAAGCTGLATLLLLSGTLPALRERDQLRRAEESRRELLDQLLVEARDLRSRHLALDRDPQAVLLEIDALGLTPEELIARHRDGAASERQR